MSKIKLIRKTYSFNDEKTGRLIEGSSLYLRFYYGKNANDYADAKIDKSKVSIIEYLFGSVLTKDDTPFDIGL